MFSLVFLCDPQSNKRSMTSRSGNKWSVNFSIFMQKEILSFCSRYLFFVIMSYNYVCLSAQICVFFMGSPCIQLQSCIFSSLFIYLFSLNNLVFSLHPTSAQLTLAPPWANIYPLSHKLIILGKTNNVKHSFRNFCFFCY